MVSNKNSNENTSGVTMKNSWGFTGFGVMAAALTAAGASVEGAVAATVIASGGQGRSRW